MSMGCFTHINHHLSQEAGSAPLETMPIDFMATMFGRHFGNNSSFPPFYLSLSFSSSFSFLGFSFFFSYNVLLFSAFLTMIFRFGGSERSVSVTMKINPQIFLECKSRVNVLAAFRITSECILKKNNDLLAK